MRQKRGWIVLVLLSVWMWGDPLYFVTGSEGNRDAAESLRRQVAAIVTAEGMNISVTVHPVENVWLVELGPIEMSDVRRQALLNGLAREGITPIPLRKNASDSDRDGGGSWTGTWSVILLLLGAGSFFLIRRFREVRRIRDRQAELERRQNHLQMEIEAGEHYHE
jgi:hypothetical protein